MGLLSLLRVEKKFSFNNRKQPDVYFDEELYKNRLRLNKQIVGLTDVNT